MFGARATCRTGARCTRPLSVGRCRASFAGVARRHRSSLVARYRPRSLLLLSSIAYLAASLSSHPFLFVRSASPGPPFAAPPRRWRRFRLLPPSLPSFPGSSPTTRHSLTVAAPCHCEAHPNSHHDSEALIAALPPFTRPSPPTPARNQGYSPTRSEARRRRLKTKANILHQFEATLHR